MIRCFVKLVIFKRKPVYAHTAIYLFFSSEFVFAFYFYLILFFSYFLFYFIFFLFFILEVQLTYLFCPIKHRSVQIETGIMVKTNTHDCHHSA